ncbi:hypothetical protein D3C85_1207990 [compost metagenome]
MTNLNKIFDKNGKFQQLCYDPYRVGPEDEEFHNMIFDADGDILMSVDDRLGTFIAENGLSPFCDAVRLFWAGRFSAATKGNYPAVYSWR